MTDASYLATRNIADADVLADGASACGSSRGEARAIAHDPPRHKRIEQETANSTAAGVHSVPHFVFENRFTINGGRREDEIATAIDYALLLFE
ncbi:TPA: DsbA family protein [Klebsiella variicola subsp. variicola]|nr:DsbA family protein [Klebsiella variicola]EKW2092667.1 DsbA family protein [Klebsiella variicola]HCI7038553.1 DsbA family protein [Klebsiella variicola subsp. variicola]